MSGHPMRVCIDARLSSGRFGGVEQVLVGIGAALSKHEDGDLEYIFLTNRGQDEWLRPYLGGPCTLLHTPDGPVRRAAQAGLRGIRRRMPFRGPDHPLPDYDKVVRQVGASLVHLILQYGFKTGLPTIYQPHDLQHLHLPGLFSDLERARREHEYRLQCSRAEVVVAMTEWGKLDLIENYGLEPEKVAIVPWASVLRNYPTPTAEDLRDVAGRLSLPDSFVIFPAHTWPHKNHERLLEAIALLRDRHGLHIPLVCPGRHTHHYRQIAKRVRELRLEELVRFPGFVSPLELRALYGLATALVFPSRFEGWGLPVCEAFEAGLPLACSSATSLPEVVGDAGLLFDPDSTEELAEAVLELWTNPGLRAELAKLGNERASHFSFDRTASTLSGLYRRVGEGLRSNGDRMLSTRSFPA